MWNELVGDYDGRGIQLAQVNCAVNGGARSLPGPMTVVTNSPYPDLCTENGVNGYPQMNLYHDGEFVQTFKGVRSRERLETFLTQYASVTPRPPPAAAAEIEHHDLQTPHPPEPPADDPNPSGEVLALTSATFQPAIEKGNVFVKFFAPW